jgi:hypothetical protein
VRTWEPMRSFIGRGFRPLPMKWAAELKITYYEVYILVVSECLSIFGIQEDKVASLFSKICKNVLIRTILTCA